MSDYIEIAAAVYAALSDDEIAELSEGIRIARLAYEDDGINEDLQGDDWYCIMMQHSMSARGIGRRSKRATKSDIIMTCVDLALLMPTAGHDWRRILGVFQSHSARVEYLFTSAAQSMIPAQPKVLRQVRKLVATGGLQGGFS